MNLKCASFEDPDIGACDMKVVFCTEHRRFEQATPEGSHVEHQGHSHWPAGWAPKTCETLEFPEKGITLRIRRGRFGDVWASVPVPGVAADDYQPCRRKIMRSPSRDAKLGMIDAKEHGRLLAEVKAEAIAAVQALPDLVWHDEILLLRDRYEVAEGVEVDADNLTILEHPLKMALQQHIFPMVPIPCFTKVSIAQRPSRKEGQLFVKFEGGAIEAMRDGDLETVERYAYTDATWNGLMTLRNWTSIMAGVIKHATTESVHGVVIMPANEGPFMLPFEKGSVGERLAAIGRHHLLVQLLPDGRPLFIPRCAGDRIDDAGPPSHEYVRRIAMLATTFDNVIPCVNKP